METEPTKNVDDVEIEESQGVSVTPKSSDDTANNEEDVEIKKEIQDAVITPKSSADTANNEEHTNKKNVVDTSSTEFAYLQRDEFTSEIYKIEVRNLGYFGIGEFKKLIKNKLQLDMTKIKSPLRKEFAFVCFRNREEQQRAIELLNGFKWKGKVLQAGVAKASADPLQKRRNEENSGSTPVKKQRTSIEATCPLYGVPYDQQLKQKCNEICDVLKRYSNSLRHMNSQFQKYEREFIYDKENIVKPSPQLDGYRNKSEFTVGYNKNNEIVVGFRLGSYADGSVEVAEVHDLPHLPELAKWAASSFQTFVRSSKCYLPFNPESNTGHLRQLMVRTSRHSGEVMIVPGIYSDNLSAEQITQFKSELKAYYETVNFEKPEYKCTSLYVQDVKRRKPGEMVSPVEHIAGTKHITEMLFDLKFAISPLAFFQINTPAAEVLYQTAIDLASPKPDSVLLDICCGTGTIGLVFSKHCRQILGVDIVPDAILDAKHNASENGIENAKFFAGNADDLIKSMVREAVYNNYTQNGVVDLIAVVDPPRSGLHSRSIAAIRATDAIQRLVYISCSPASAKRNWLDLGRPESKQFRGEPFFPKKAIAVDLFPNTMHTELVILFERVKTAVTENVPTIDESVNLKEVESDEKINTNDTEETVQQCSIKQDSQDS